MTSNLALAGDIIKQWQANPGLAGDPDLQTRIAQALDEKDRYARAVYERELKELQDLHMANVQENWDKWAASATRLEAKDAELANLRAANAVLVEAMREIDRFDPQASRVCTSDAASRRYWFDRNTKNRAIAAESIAKAQALAAFRGEGLSFNGIPIHVCSKAPANGWGFVPQGATHCQYCGKPTR